MLENIPSLYRSLADIANHQRFIPEPRVLLTALKLAIGETLGWRRGKRMQTRMTFPITTPLSTRGNPDVAAPEAHSRSRNRGVPEINEYSLFRNSNLTRETHPTATRIWNATFVRHFSHSSLLLLFSLLLYFFPINY